MADENARESSEERSIDETDEILSDPEEAAEVRAGIAEIDHGEGVEMTKNEMLAYIRNEERRDEDAT